MRFGLPRAVARRMEQLLGGHGYAKAAVDTAVGLL